MKSYFLIFCISLKVFSMQPQITQAPQTIEQFKEIATQYNTTIVSLFNVLTPQERVFIYYMYRACLPGNLIAADQLHRHSLAMIDICEQLYAEQEKLLSQDVSAWLPVEQRKTFLEQLHIYLVYLWSNHGNYFAREHVNEKRTPERLGLTLLTQENIINALQLLNKKNLVTLCQEIAPSFFDASIEPTNCVANSIEKSAVNLYSPDFTEDDFQTLPSDQRTHLNGYYSVAIQDGKRIPVVQRYKIGGKYSQELEVSQYWLTQALEHARRYPQQFDEHMTKSLEHLITFLSTGDEADFRKHSIEWLQTNNRIDYVFGFIENYQDPKEYRGMFEAEVTIKSIDMSLLNAILPSCEDKLPFPAEFKRPNLDSGAAMPNASINVIAFGSGWAGPLQLIAAYCLPNYEDIRSSYGSKQVIYQDSKGLGQLLNPEMHKKLFYTKEHAEFLQKNDPDDTLQGDIWNVHCILHETLGHGSGKLASHTFETGDSLFVDGKQYAIGDTLALTPENIGQFFAGNGQALEELRAEILALYTCIFMFDDLANAGLYKEWPQKIGKEKLIEWLVYDMARVGLKVLQVQSLDTDTISGAHAQANSIIMNYLLEAGALELVEEARSIEGTEYTVLGFTNFNHEKAYKAITDLAIMVQTIKSTANGQEFTRLLEKYGLKVRSMNYVKMLKAATEAVVGDLKAKAYIYPFYEPIYEQDTIVDVHASWPESFAQQQMVYRNLALSKR